MKKEIEENIKEIFKSRAEARKAAEEDAYKKVQDEICRKLENIKLNVKAGLHIPNAISVKVSASFSEDFYKRLSEDFGLELTSESKFEKCLTLKLKNN